MTRWLVCGTRKKGYESIVYTKLNNLLKETGIIKKWHCDLTIIQGGCPDSADEYAYLWAKAKDIQCISFSAVKGNYLKRNIEMIDSFPDVVIAFWDGFSYGTAHTIATAVSRGIKIELVTLK